MDLNKIYNGNCLEVLKDFPDNFFDGCVTDPPYGISFMNKHWDYQIPSVDIWKEILRVLKPGGYVLCACGTRTQHRMAVNIEDAGFEIRDVITWHYGSGFPKSHDISKAIDRQAGAERTVIDTKETKSGGMANVNKANKEQGFRPNNYNEHGNVFEITEPATDAAKEWDGWGTALKPATEFWTMARKPLSESTVAENVLKHGTGGININGSRISLNGEKPPTGSAKRVYKANDYTEEKIYGDNKETSSLGRFPANVIFDEFTGQILDQQSGMLKSGMVKERKEGYESNGATGFLHGYSDHTNQYGDSGGASRFFYCAKASNAERNKGLNGFEAKERDDRGNNQATRVCIDCGLTDNGINDHSGCSGEYDYKKCSPIKNTHPTIKPVDLMRYLVKLIIPKNGIVVDPFIGSGTTGIAAKMEMINYVGVELQLEYCKIAEARIKAWNPDAYKPQTLF